ncbi:hypothetical protein ACEN9X_20485 [Mucilaginibacter sp. Mucisp86]|uniref:hypothetical protein n=1 Tax=Mucilaginibacter sp. Mucisp86 TaxID=3243060 RepID=UPI0039B57D11
MNLLDTDIALMLKDMQAVFALYDINFYLVGAVARDILLPADPEMASTCKTLDVDIAIMLSSADEFKTLKAALLATGDFTANPTEAIRVYYHNSIEVDLLPFGDIESVTRMIHLTDPTFVLHMPGFREIYPFTQEVIFNEDQSQKVCSLEGIVLLKLISHSDRPERTKDLKKQYISQFYAISSLPIFTKSTDTQWIKITVMKCRIFYRFMKGFLSAKIGMMPNINQVYNTFKSYAYGLLIEDIVAEITGYSGNYTNRYC